MAVAASLPLALAGGGVQAHHDPVIEAVDESLVYDEVRELGLEPDALPNHRRAEAAVGTGLDLEKLGTDTVSGRRESADRRQGGRVGPRWAAGAAIRDSREHFHPPDRGRPRWRY